MTKFMGQYRLFSGVITTLTCGHAMTNAPSPSMFPVFRSWREWQKMGAGKTHHTKYIFACLSPMHHPCSLRAWNRLHSSKIHKILTLSLPDKQIAPCESTGTELSFEWSHHRISFADSKIRLALQNLIKHSGSEGVNHAEMSKSSARVEISRISASSR